MTRHKQIVIHAEQTEDFSFTISAQAEDGQPVPLNEMKRQLSNGTNHLFTEHS
ncbi:hypothetical protein ACTWKB_20785 [Bacillus sp. 4A_MP2]